MDLFDLLQQNDFLPKNVSQIYIKLLIIYSMIVLNIPKNT